MKKLCALFLVMFISCGENFLETLPATILPTDVALDKPDGLEGAIYALYDFPRQAIRGSTDNLYFIAGTHLVKGFGLLSPDKEMAFYNSGLNSTHGATKDFWNTSYKALQRANTIIGRADKMEFPKKGGVEGAERKSRLIAEARFFRAFILFYLEQRFERIPLITEEVIEPINSYQPASKDDIYDVIIDDLLYAIDNLKEKSKYNEAGRITKGAAQHLLAKVYMVLEQWSDAAAMATAVINSGEYSLLSDRSQLWADDNQNNTEGIYVIQFANNALDGGENYLAPMFTPLIDRITGVVRSFENGGRPWARFYPSEYLLGLFDPTDKRLDADYKTVWFYDDDGVDDKGNPILPRKIQPFSDSIVSIEENDDGGYDTTYFKPDSIEIHLGDTVKWEHVHNIQWYGPACKKFWEYGTSRDLQGAGCRKAVIRYRLGETYLIAGEAYWRDNNTDSALIMINKVRERAGVEPFTELNEDMILDELSRELAFEMDDWFYLKRMGRLVSMVKEHSPDKAQTHIEEFYERMGQHMRMPIPQTFLDATPGYSIGND